MFTKFKTLRKYLKTVGLFKTIQILFLFKTVRKGITTVRFRGLKSGVKVRLGSKDIDIFNQIFIRKDYRLNLPFEPHFIIDCGANVGYSAVFFSNAYPEAKIVAVEPEEKNFEILSENVKSYSNVVPLRSGIWNKEAYLKVVDPGVGNWGFQIIEVDPEDKPNVPAFTIHKIMEIHNMKEIDILKIDIEGSEKEVFSEGYESWLPKTKVLIIELHDDLKAGTSSVFFNAIGKFNFKYRKDEENFICFNQNFIK